jgi:hypothetical protein
VASDTRKARTAVVDLTFVLDQGVDQTYPANTRCLTTHDDMMKDRIEQYLVKHGFDHTSFDQTFFDQTLSG